ncbi:MAG TPA: hypothetical protein VHA52_02965, partial [Candidatus Babeliaceae bacterium]|nr:hypothetical protein [Candidatus Babeliaceae bacterium]
MIKNLFAFLFFLLGAATAQAQYENVWAFGESTGMDFNSGIPVVITTHILGDEGTASVCDSSGQLLFYTEGSFVWDRNGNIMPNGVDLVPGASVYLALNEYTPTSSTSQAALIVPVIGDKNKYYIFSLTSCIVDMAPSTSTLNRGQLYYSVLDMSLNNGLGDIVAGQKEILLDTGLAESLTAVVGNRCDIWVVAATIKQNIKAWEITAAGIDTTPVLSIGIDSTIIPSFLPTGCIAISPDKKKLVATLGGFDTIAVPIHASAAVLYDFDPATGEVTNGLSLYPYFYDSTGISNGYGVCFSPDNTKLYVQDIENSGSYIRQFDLSSGDPAIIPTT